jgi:hypothetical protein
MSDLCGWGVCSLQWREQAYSRVKIDFPPIFRREVVLIAGAVEVVGVCFLAIWLGLETLWDQFRSVILPLWLVLPPVAAGIIVRAVGADWIIAAAMAAALVLHLSDHLWIRMIGTGLLAGASYVAGNWVLLAGFVLYWLLWELNIAGGADALAAYAALMIIPRSEMFWSLLAGILIWALFIMAVTYRGKFFERWKQLAWRIILKNFPDASELETEGKPTVGGIWIGVILCILWSGLRITT